MRPLFNSVYNCYKSGGIFLITSLRQGSRNSSEQKFNHCFEDIINLVCSSENDLKSTELFSYTFPTLLMKDALFWVLKVFLTTVCEKSFKTQFAFQEIYHLLKVRNPILFIL